MKRSIRGTGGRPFPEVEWRCLERGHDSEQCSKCRQGSHMEWMVKSKFQLWECVWNEFGVC